MCLCECVYWCGSVSLYGCMPVWLGVSLFDLYVWGCVWVYGCLVCVCVCVCLSPCVWVCVSDRVLLCFAPFKMHWFVYPRLYLWHAHEVLRPFCTLRQIHKKIVEIRRKILIFKTFNWHFTAFHAHCSISSDFQSCAQLIPTLFFYKNIEARRSRTN